MEVRNRADIWSLAMTLFILYNPDLPFPYSEEINANPGMTAQQVLQQNLTLKKPPQNSTIYDYMQANVSRILGDIIQKCLTWDSKDRPDINEVRLFLGEECEYISIDVPLRNSQNSALEKLDRLVACGQCMLCMLCINVCNLLIFIYFYFNTILTAGTCKVHSQSVISGRHWLNCIEHNY